MRCSKYRCLGLILLVLAPSVAVLATSTPASAASWTPVYNVDFPDPDISLFGGIYYAYSTQVRLDNVPVATSTDGITWVGGHNDTFPVLPTWSTFGFTWAPTVGETSLGTYVMYYTARDTSTGVQCIGEATSVLPLGPFVDAHVAPVICQSGVGGSIDPSIFTDTNGTSYLIWKSDGDSTGDISGLWSQPLDSSLNLEGSPSLLLVNGGQSWQGSLIEGPDMVKADGRYYLFYSGNNYDTANYAVGYTTCVGPLGPCTNTSFNPVLSSSEGMSGPGGESFFTGPDGQLLMAFAAFPGPVGYENGGQRALYVASVGFSGGVPYFDPYNTPLPDVGYWQVGADGGVFSFGSAQFYGSAGNIRLNKPIVGMAATPDGGGYWLVASDGGIFAFGDARFYGSTGDIALNKPIVGMAVDAGTGGYWLVASDGGIFAFHAPFLGSTGAIALAQPIVGMAALPDGGGYWLAASDGGVFAFDVPYLGSATGDSSSPVTSITPSDTGDGYWLSNAAGAVYYYGDAPSFGSSLAAAPNARIVSFAAVH